MGRDFRQHGLDALHGKHRPPPAFFQGGNVGTDLAGQLRRFIALLAQGFQIALRGLHLGFQPALLLLLPEEIAELFGDESLALSVFFADALEFAFVSGKPLTHARHFAFQLAQGVFGGHGLTLGLALLVFETLKQVSEFSDIAAQRRDVSFLLADGALQFTHLEQHLAQLALHRQRTLAALLAAGNGDVVEAFTGLREEEGIRIFQRESAAYFGVGHDVAVAEFRQDDFQRFAKAVEHTNAVLEGNDGIGVGDVMHRLVEVEGKLRLRILGMNEEGGAAIDVGTQQAQAFVSGIPRLNDNEVQFVAQEIVDHVLIAVLNFKEVGKNAHGRAPALQGSRSEELANRVGGIAVIGDDGFERASLAHQRGVFAAQRIEMTLGIGLGGPLDFQLIARAGDLCGEGSDTLRGSLKFQSQLAALAAEAFELLLSGGGVAQ